MAKSTRSAAARKPQKPGKPRPDFPLFDHDNGRWAKKVCGKLAYFGKWADDPEGVEALKLWITQKDELLSGKPQVQITRREKYGGGLPLHRLVNEFLNAKRKLVDAGRLSRRTFAEYVTTSERVTAAFGRERNVATLTPADFSDLYAALAKTRGPVAVGNEVVKSKMIFRFGFEEGLLDTPVRFGAGFSKPTKGEIAKIKARSGDDDATRTFTADELRRILAEIDDDPATKAQVLLAVNAAYGAADLARLNLRQVDIEAGWARSRRPKTGVDRGAKLWGETVAALKAYLAVRPEARDPAHAELLFLTRKGKPFLRQSEGIDDDGEVDPRKWIHRTDLIGREFARVLKRLGINGRRGVYNLRHTAATIADERVPDRQAVKYLLGHSGGSITDGYVHKHPADERMQAIADAVHAWLFGKGGAA